MPRTAETPDEIGLAFGREIKRLRDHKGLAVPGVVSQDLRTSPCVGQQLVT